ncbi:MAG: TetR/AcrR family transcriptional regulator [Bacteroidota bacterium]
MCPRTSEQFEEIRDTKRRQILYAAIECFATSGYHSVSISDLAKHAGISKGLMYNYFSSKEELLKTIFREVMEEMLGIFNPGQAGEIDRAILLNYMNRFFDHLSSSLTLWKMYMAIFSQPAVLQILEKDIIEVSDQPLKMLERYFAKQGYEEPALEVSFLSTITSGVMYEYIADPLNYPLDKMKQRIIGLY